MNVVYLLFALLLFGAPFIGSIEVGGVSVVLLRDAGLIALCVMFLLKAGSRHRRPRLFGAPPAWALWLLLLSVYVAINTMLSVNGSNAASIAVRLFGLSAVAMTLICVDDVRGAYQKAILQLLAAYCLVSLVVAPFVGEYLEGPLGRHFTKFVALTGFCLSLSLIANGLNRRISYACAALSVTVGILCLQRGFVIAAFVALLVTMLLLKVSVGLRVRVLAAALVLGGGAWMVIGDRLVEYAFYEGVGPAQIVSSIADGSFELSMLRTRSRLDLADIVITGSQVSVLGHGAGWSKYLIGGFYGEGKEPHNDMLVLLFDYGLLGLSLFFLFLLSFFRRGKNMSRQGGRIGAHALAATSLMSGCVAWMFFSNVLIYSMAGLAFSIAFMALAEAEVAKGQKCSAR